MEDLRQAVAWYVDVVPPSTLVPYRSPPEPGTVETTLAAIDAAISPLRLPAEVLWFWRHWDPYAFEYVPYPRLCDPTAALESWELNAVQGHDPRILFPVAYESHGFLLVELGDRPGRPAPVWKYSYCDNEFVCAYPSLAALFHSCAATVEALGGSTSGADDGSVSYYDLFHDPAFDAFVDSSFAASAEAERRRVPYRDARRWPARWRAVQGIDDELLARRGRTHTVAEFEAAAASGPVAGRLWGRFRAAAGGGFGAGGASVAMGPFTDETGALVVLLPDAVVDVGGQDGRVDVEVDVEASGPIGTTPELDGRPASGAALSGDLDAAGAIAEELGRALEEAVPRIPVITRMVPLSDEPLER